MCRKAMSYLNHDFDVKAANNGAMYNTSNHVLKEEPCVQRSQMGHVRVLMKCIFTRMIAHTWPLNIRSDLLAPCAPVAMHASSDVSSFKSNLYL